MGIGVRPLPATLTDKMDAMITPISNKISALCLVAQGKPPHA
jgi:hypothetical protein